MEAHLRQGTTDIGTLAEVFEARLERYGSYAEPRHEKLCPDVPEYAERLGKLLIDEDEALAGRPFVREGAYLGVVIAERVQHGTYSAHKWLSPAVVPEVVQGTILKARSAFMRELLPYRMPRLSMRQVVHQGLKLRETPQPYLGVAMNAALYTLMQADDAARQAHFARMDKMLFSEDFDPSQYQLPDQSTNS